MELSITVGALVAGVALVAAMRLREGRSRTSLHVPLLPTTPVMFIGIVMILLATIHLFGLLGYGGR
ncbi:MAG TPA: hypothetical protein VHK03_07860 [Aestuariivirgaceae bacterium]|jgi:hypothetical protein|nr:hypothetical protein [Aestuariivirgaceae bacterium]